MGINVKKIKLALKYHKGIEQLAEESEMSVEELKDAIVTIFKNPKQAAEDIGELERNQVRFEKNKEKAKQRKRPDLPNTDGLTEISVEEGTPKPEKLDMLNRKKDEILQNINELEEDIAELERARHEVFEECKEIKKQIDGYYREIMKMKEQVQEGTEKVSNLDADIKKAKSQIEVQNEKLAEIGREIDELSIVTILVGSDGSIEAPEDPNFVIDDSGYQELKTKIADLDECQDLRVREVTTLARLLMVLARTEKFELICDSEELEQAFIAVRERSAAQ